MNSHLYAVTKSHSSTIIPLKAMIYVPISANESNLAPNSVCNLNIRAINPSRISVTRLMEINVINSVLSCTTRAYTMKGNAKILYADNALGTLYIFSLAFMLFFTAKFLMCMCKMACGKCCRNGQFTRQHHSSTYLGKL